MGITAYASDIHGNVGYAKALTTVLGDLKSAYSVDTNAVIAGDFTSQDVPQSEKDIEPIMKAKKKEAVELNQAFSSMKGHVYGILGNHDPSMITKDLSAVQFIEYKPVDIDGKKYYGVTHSSANFYAQDEEKYATLESKMAEVERILPSVDVLVAHEGPNSGFSHMGTHQHPRLADLVKKHKKTFLCGHVHEARVEELSKGQYGIRAFAQDNARGMTYLRVRDGKDDVLYELSNQALIKWAQSINPKGQYVSDESAFADYIAKRDPAHLQEVQLFQQQLQAVQEQFTTLNAGKQVTQEDFVNFITQQHPELLKLNDKILATQNKYAAEFKKKKG